MKDTASDGESFAWVPRDVLDACPDGFCRRFGAERAPGLNLPQGARVTAFCDPNGTVEPGDLAACVGGVLDYARPEGNAVWRVLWLSVEP